MESRTPLFRVRTGCSPTSALRARWPRLDSNQHATRAPRSEHGGSTEVPPRGQTLVGLAGVEPAQLRIPNAAAYHQALSPLISAGNRSRTRSSRVETWRATVNTPPAWRRVGESNPAGLSTLPRFQRSCAPCCSLSSGRSGNRTHAAFRRDALAGRSGSQLPFLPAPAL